RHRLRARPSRGHRFELLNQDRFRQESGGLVTGNASSTSLGVSMPEPKIRDRLVGGWRLTGHVVTASGKTDRPAGADPLGTILYTTAGYMSAQLAGPGPHFGAPRQRGDEHHNDQLGTPATAIRR